MHTYGIDSEKRMEGGKVLCINCGILLFFPCNPEEASLTIRHTHKKCTPYGNIILCVKNENSFVFTLAKR